MRSISPVQDEQTRFRTFECGKAEQPLKARTTSCRGAKLECHIWMPGANSGDTGQPLSRTTLKGVGGTDI